MIFLRVTSFKRCLPQDNTNVRHRPEPINSPQKYVIKTCDHHKVFTLKFVIKLKSVALTHDLELLKCFSEALLYIICFLIMNIFKLQIPEKFCWFRINRINAKGSIWWSLLQKKYINLERTRNGSWECEPSFNLGHQHYQRISWSQWPLSKHAPRSSLWNSKQSVHIGVCITWGRPCAEQIILSSNLQTWLVSNLVHNKNSARLLLRSGSQGSQVPTWRQSPTC